MLTFRQYILYLDVEDANDIPLGCKYKYCKACAVRKVHPLGTVRRERKGKDFVNRIIIGLKDGNESDWEENEALMQNMFGMGRMETKKIETPQRDSKYFQPMHVEATLMDARRTGHNIASSGTSNVDETPWINNQSERESSIHTDLRSACNEQVGCW